MEKMSKLKIAENLKLFYAISEHARTDVKKTYLEIYYELCDESKLEEKSEDSYREIVLTSMLINTMNMLGIIKDEMLKFMRKDNNINSSLSFLNRCFVNGSDPSKFNKVDVITYIRNAFFHSNDKNLYSVNKDLSIDIHMPGISLYLHLDINTLNKICNFVNHHTQRAFVYGIADEKSMNVQNILQDEKSSANEISKIRVRKIQNKNKASDTRHERIKKLPQQEMNEIENVVDYLVDPTKPKQEFIFSFSPEQCLSIAKEIMMYKKFFNDQVLTLFINQIILSNTEHGVLKYDKINFDLLTANEFLYPGNYSFLEMCTTLNTDLRDFISRKKIEENNFFKRNYYNYGVLNGDVYKIIYIYIMRLALRQNQALTTYYAYVYTNLLEDFGTEEDEHIRNAFAHKRFIWLEGPDTKTTSICLFDNENDVRRPVGITSANWTKTYTLEEMHQKVESIYIRAVNKSGLKSGITF